MAVIDKIAASISAIDGVELLDVDPGKATNRTVVTFVGSPDAVVEAAFQAIVTAGDLIDMRNHKGEHARMGATDVCPFIPVSGISLEETAEYAIKLAKRIGQETDIPVYLYGAAQSNRSRNDLSVIRSGEYEGFFEKIKQPEWAPDFGPAEMNAKKGATVIGARDFLIAYNINLNSKSARIANRIAFDVREAGRVKRIGDPYTGAIATDENGESVRIPGKCKSVKAVGWFIEEYGIAQISANLTNYKVTSIHEFFDAVVESADSRGVRVTGSELVGLLPLKALRDAGIHYLKKQGRSIGVPESEIIEIAIKSLGLDELGPFDPNKKIIEYRMKKPSDEHLIGLSAKDLANETSRESMAPGGGSISAYVGALGASLSSMVANLSANKRGWESKLEEFSQQAAIAQEIKDKLLYYVDEDTRSFNAIIEAIRLPKDTPEEKQIRSEAIENASQYAARVPLEVMRTAQKAMNPLAEMISKGNPNSITDAGVGILCVKTCVEGAYMNVLINIKDLGNKEVAEQLRSEADKVANEVREQADKILNDLFSSLKG